MRISVVHVVLGESAAEVAAALKDGAAPPEGEAARLPRFPSA